MAINLKQTNSYREVLVPCHKCGWVHRARLWRKGEEVYEVLYRPTCPTCRAEGDMQYKARVFLKAKARYEKMLASQEKRRAAGKMPKASE